MSLIYINLVDRSLSLAKVTSDCLCLLRGLVIVTRCSSEALVVANEELEMRVEKAANEDYRLRSRW